MSSLQSEGVVIVRIPPVRFGRPTLDKVHAWNLTQYDKVLAIDSDAIALQALDPVFEYREGVMGCHAYELFQGKCNIPADSRGQGGFFLLEPRLGGFEELVGHIDGHPEYWDMTLTNHTPQQTGISCFFATQRRSLRTLPCPFWYDVSNEEHLAGQKHYRLCRKWQANETVCGEVAKRIKKHCLWKHKSKQVRAVHLKGSMKPYRNIPRRCEALMAGGVLALSPNGSAIPVAPLDNLVLESFLAQATCKSQDLQLPVVFASTRQPLHESCCHFTTLVKAEWWRLFAAHAGRHKSTAGG